MQNRRAESVAPSDRPRDSCSPRCNRPPLRSRVRQRAPDRHAEGNSALCVAISGLHRPRAFRTEARQVVVGNWQRRGWRAEAFELYGRKGPRHYKTFLATWRPAGGVIRVALVERDGTWAAFFCIDPGASVADVVTAAADRASIEQAFHDLREAWDAGQQQ